MPFISYAQNFEDIILWRALGHIQNGFYVDVGANDPEVDSVTKAFYDRGWCGINVEPVPKWFDKLKANRNRDINLNVAAGNVDGSLALFEIPNTGLSTLSREIAQRHKHESGYEFIERLVPVTRLTDIIAAHHSGPIHFLKIDVEGAEREVLQGLDLNKLRPWIILVEATLPNLPTGNHDAWEPILLGGRYEFAYFDGLNRFYLAKEHEELADHFKVPPNFFDDFALSSTCFLARNVVQEAESRERQAICTAQQSEKRAREFEVQSKEAGDRAKEIEARLREVYLSRSWRVTAPLRRLMSRIRAIKRRVPRSKQRAAQMLLVPIARRLVMFAAGKPSVWRYGVLSCKSLGIYHRARSIYSQISKTQSGIAIRVASPTSQNPSADGQTQVLLSPAERRVYDELRSAIKNMGRGAR